MAVKFVAVVKPAVVVRPAAVVGFPEIAKQAVRQEPAIVTKKQMIPETHFGQKPGRQISDKERNKRCKKTS